MVGPWLLLLPALVLKLLFHIGPSIATLVLSLTDASVIRYRPVSFVGLDNFKTILGVGSRQLGIALRNTITYTAIVVVFQNLLGLTLALVLNREFIGRNALRAFFYVPIILGVVVSGMLWRLMFYPFGGLVSGLLETVFGFQSAYFDDPDLAISLSGIAHTWMYIGFSALIYLAGFQAIPVSLYESAAIDGAGPLARFRYVTLPFLAQAVTINVLITTTGTLRSFDLILVLTGGKTEQLTLAYLSYSTAFGEGKQGLASAQALLLFAMILVVALIQQHYLRKREVTV